MTHFPSTIAGAAILTGGAPAADPALALHAEYRAAVERTARAYAADPEARRKDADVACEAMLDVEERIINDTPMQSLGVAAVKLMAAVNIYRRCENDVAGAEDDYRHIMEEVAALAGLPVVDYFETVARHKGFGA